MKYVLIAVAIIILYALGTQLVGREDYHAQPPEQVHRSN